MIQLPAFMMLLPQFPVTTLLATNKLVSLSGTAVSAYRFSRHIPYIRAIILPAMLTAFLASALGAYSVTLVSNEFLKPFFFVLLIFAFLFTLRNKTFGTVDHDPKVKIQVWKPILIGLLIGFYDGFFGPGTGSFLIISFVGLLGMTFVQGSAYAKVINVATNVAAIIFFIWKADFLYRYAVPMAVFNVTGSMLGVRFALLKGNEIVRILLRGIVFLTILKIGFDLYL